MKRLHTIGPWTIFTERGCTPVINGGEPGKPVATIDSGKMADARLCRIAPELLQAAEELLDALAPGKGTLKDEVVPAYDKMRAVIRTLAGPLGGEPLCGCRPRMKCNLHKRL